MLAKGAKWKSTEDIIIDTSNAFGLSQGFIIASIEVSARTWQEALGTPLYSGFLVQESDGIDEIAPDGSNEIVFGEIADPSVIAATIVWGIFGGPPKDREIVEFDMLFDTDFTWGDALLDPSVMDLQNIATHELGHSFGLADLYDSRAVNETMYGYSTEGETLKRDLYYGDIAGIQSLYGRP